MDPKAYTWLLFTCLLYNILCILGLANLMLHMHSQRKKKLGGTKKSGSSASKAKKTN